MGMQGAEAVRQGEECIAVLLPPSLFPPSALSAAPVVAEGRGQRAAGMSLLSRKLYYS